MLACILFLSAFFYAWAHADRLRFDIFANTFLEVCTAFMLLAAKPIGDFVDANPTIKMLALSFLILVGFTLIAEGFGPHIPKGYIYFAMAFAIGVETLNLLSGGRNRVPKPAPASDD